MRIQDCEPKFRSVIGQLSPRRAAYSQRLPRTLLLARMNPCLVVSPPVGSSNLHRSCLQQPVSRRHDPPVGWLGCGSQRGRACACDRVADRRIGGIRPRGSPEGWGATVYPRISVPSAFGGLIDFNRHAGWIAAACRDNQPGPEVEKVPLPRERAITRHLEHQRDGVDLHPPSDRTVGGPIQQFTPSCARRAGLTLNLVVKNGYLPVRSLQYRSTLVEFPEPTRVCSALSEEIQWNVPAAGPGAPALH